MPNFIKKFQRVTPSGVSNKGGVDKISDFLDLTVNISKTAKVTINN